MVDSRFSELVKELGTEPMKIEVKELRDDKPVSRDILQQKQIELMVEMAVKKLELKLDALREEIVSVKKEVEHVKARPAQVAQPSQVQSQMQDSIKVPDNIPVEGFMQVKAPSRDPMSSTAEHSKGEGTQVHPRLGNYKTEDVSVEKFFNFGRK
ncbi:hypothetical protein HYV81_00355 [Candidatus Woesearchaeota archaeon]|nr:hypothetical protein [Candidatus Woesearchaeota archaeon]